MKIEEAMLNLDTVVANSRMTRGEHNALIESLQTVKNRCDEATKLEQKVSELELLQKHENKD
jgi:hypothetical protein